MVMPVPYESTGRRGQKARTREALVVATRRLLADGIDPTVEQAAAEARISRTTAYRYFPNRRALLLAAHPEIVQPSLLPPDAPDDDVPARLDLVLSAFARVNLDWEPQLRTSLRLSPGPGHRLDRGRAAPAAPRSRYPSPGDRDPGHHGHRVADLADRHRRPVPSGGGQPDA
jgi:AcrR family transcriptional regulator